MKKSPLLSLLLIVVVSWLLLKTSGFFGAPVPASLIYMYMFFILIVTLLVMTSSASGVDAFSSTLKRFFCHRRFVVLRNISLVSMPLILALLTYLAMRSAAGPPVRLRSVHPAPPPFMHAYGQTFNLQSLKNPLRKLERGDQARFKSLVREGGVLYYKNCLFCHGALLDGRGHLSAGMNPLPQPFAGINTIAQLRESYLFWRIVTGGAGLPVEAAPWNSVMPSWEATLNEQEVWKLILFLYDYTGNRPLKWD